MGRLGSGFSEIASVYFTSRLSHDFQKKFPDGDLTFNAGWKCFIKKGSLTRKGWRKSRGVVLTLKLVDTFEKFERASTTFEV